MRFIRSFINTAAILSMPIWGGLAALIYMVAEMLDGKEGRARVREILTGEKWLLEE